MVLATLECQFVTEHYYTGFPFGCQGWRLGGLGAVAPPSEHASPPVRRWKAIFSEIFGIYSTLKIVF